MDTFLHNLPENLFSILFAVLFMLAALWIVGRRKRGEKQVLLSISPSTQKAIDALIEEHRKHGKPEYELSSLIADALKLYNSLYNHSQNGRPTTVLINGKLVPVFVTAPRSPDSRPSHLRLVVNNEIHEKTPPQPPG